MLRVLGRRNSVNVQKVLWALEELTVPYVQEDYGGEFGRVREPDYLALNPNGTVPAVVDDDVVLWESNTIVRYLYQRYGTAGALDAPARARRERWMDWQLQSLAAPIQAVFVGLWRTPPEKRDADAIARGLHTTNRLLGVADGELARAPWLSGASFDYGDIPVGAWMYRWMSMDIARDTLPRVDDWYRRLCERPGYARHIMVSLA